MAEYLSRGTTTLNLIREIKADPDLGVVPVPMANVGQLNHAASVRTRPAGGKPRSGSGLVRGMSRMVAWMFDRLPGPSAVRPVAEKIARTALQEPALRNFGDGTANVWRGWTEYRVRVLLVESNIDYGANRRRAHNRQELRMTRYCTDINHRTLLFLRDGGCASLEPSAFAAPPPVSCHGVPAARRGSADDEPPTPISTSQCQNSF